MKTSLAISAMLSLFAVGCGSANDALNQADSSLKRNATVTCSIQTNNGHYLTAVGGGGRTNDVLHTDATRVGAWENFRLIDTGEGSPIRYGIQTNNGHFLTAVGGGGRVSDVIHSDATQLQAWEKFTLIALGGGEYAIQTVNGHYLTAVGAGGLVTDAIHTDATWIQAWEKFRINCHM